VAIWIRRPIVPPELRAAQPSPKTSPDADIYFTCDDPSEVFDDAAAAAAFGASQEDGSAPAPYVSSLTQWERRIAHAARLNLLLIATDVNPREVLDALRSDCPEPIMTWAPGEVLVLPANAQTGTLLLEDISALALEDQRRLHRWLDASTGWMQVVSITSRCLLPSIKAGAFLERLYYRLNIICGEVARGAERPHDRP
jgi:hypothetical protein